MTKHKRTLENSGRIDIPEINVTPGGNYIYNPYDNIRLHYKSGGNKPITTGGAGYIPDNYGYGAIDIVRSNLYNNLIPVGYQPIGTVLKAAIGIPDRPDIQNKYPKYRDDLFAEYLGINSNAKHKIEGKLTISPSRYRPTKGTPNPRTFKIDNLTNKDKKLLIETAGNLNMGDNKEVKFDSTVFDGLGRFTIGRGRDLKGDYVSYYDDWNLTPFGNSSSGGGGGNDQSFGIGNPFDVYDRIYLDDYYQVPVSDRRGHYLPEIIVTGTERRHLKSGGSIHIAPSKRGTFTAAATKHGKSVQAFASQVLANKENYSPAMVKKANFAKNASKWR